jgi:hypothetical protein
MPDIEPISRRKFSHKDCAAVQEQVSQAVEADSERLIAADRLDSRSFRGRYVNSDLMKDVNSWIICEWFKAICKLHALQVYSRQ